MIDFPFQVRAATQADAAALATLAARTFRDTYGAQNRPEDMLAHLTSAYGVAQQTREILDPRWATIVIESGAMLVGYTQVRRAPAPAGATIDADAEIHRFYVDAEFHGTGASAPLMSAALGAARGMGASAVWLGVWERNARAIRFYEKQGFQDAGTTFFMVGPDRQTDRVMVRAL